MVLQDIRAKISVGRFLGRSSSIKVLIKSGCVFIKEGFAALPKDQD